MTPLNLNGNTHDLPGSPPPTVEQVIPEKQLRNIVNQILLFTPDNEKYYQLLVAGFHWQKYLDLQHQP